LPEHVGVGINENKLVLFQKLDEGFDDIDGMAIRRNAIIE